MNKLLFILVLPVLLSACGAQPAVDLAVVQNAIQQTVAADWTATFTPAPTSTPAPTGTPTVSPTVTSTPLPTATPTLTPTATPDLRLIDADPHDFLLTAADLPLEDLFYQYEWLPPENHAYFAPDLPNPWHTRIFSDWSIRWATFYGGPQQWGSWTGQAELEANGLVDSWWVKYDSDTVSAAAPMYISDHVVLFRSIEGAQLMLNEFGWCTISYRVGDYLLESFETDLMIGDRTRACSYRWEFSGLGHVNYIIEFTYRNFYHQILGYDQGAEAESAMSLDYLEAVARTLLAKLEAAPLSNIVTYHP